MHLHCYEQNICAVPMHEFFTIWPIAESTYMSHLHCQQINTGILS